MTGILIGSEQEMLAAIRARKDELRITNETIDAVAGLPNGYCGKLLCDPPIKRMGAFSLGLILGAMGYTIHLVPDAEAFARVKNRLPTKRPGRGPGRQPGEQPISSRRRPPWLINAERARQFADLRMSKLTAQQRSTIARNAAAARWKRCSRSRADLSGR